MLKIELTSVTLSDINCREFPKLRNLLIQEVWADYSKDKLQEFIKLFPNIEDLHLEIENQELNMELNVPKLKSF